ncbi:uncharacterized protein BXZ73DRAFT_76888 [Epithele typhae]|uniref:uncharacterized protein n=1 Tax=Epithele typhae TaxID=378194 RepID=UPI0020087E91|nr:uncharacterized protein BXZ73DRAFT_76888 [Epithele typhae]KAH9935190.1 hypothetical protein BXZ73DRAFT_76888 [Epithele typhae]
MAISSEDDIATTVRSAEGSPLGQLSVASLSPWLYSRAGAYERLDRTLRNADTPLHRALPPEILSEIFVYHATAGKGRPIALAHVCQYWRQIALSSPRFWAALALSPSGPFLDLTLWDDFTDTARTARREYATAVLQLSKAVPLSLDIRGIPRTIGDVLAPHTGRIRVLRSKVSKAYLPVLHTLPHIPVDFFLYVSRPTLRTAYITRPLQKLPVIPHPPDQPFFVSSPLPILIRPGAALVDALRGCPELRHVSFHFTGSLRGTLNGIKNDQAARAAWRSSTQVSLKSLQSLCIHVGRTTCTIPTFLQLFSVSDLPFIRLELDVDPVEDTVWEDLLECKALAPRLRLVTQAYLWPVLKKGQERTIEALAVTCIDDKSRQILDVIQTGDKYCPLPLRRLKGLASVLCAQSALVQLSICLHDRFYSDASHYHNLLRMFPSIQELVVSGPWAPAVLRALRTMEDKLPPCPKLRTLRVHFAVTSSPGFEGHALWKALAGKPDGWTDVLRATLVAHRDALAETLFWRAAAGARLEDVQWGERAWDPRSTYGSRREGTVRTATVNPSFIDFSGLQGLSHHHHREATAASLQRPKHTTRVALSRRSEAAEELANLAGGAEVMYGTLRTHPTLASAPTAPFATHSPRSTAHG